MERETIYMLHYKDCIGDEELMGVYRSLESAKECAETYWEYNMHYGKRGITEHSSPEVRAQPFHDKIEWEQFTPDAWGGYMFPDKPQQRNNWPCWLIRSTTLYPN